MRRLRPLLALTAILCGSVAAEPDLLLGKAYPIEVTVSQHAALLHWLDSLTGLQNRGATAGKTIVAHRLQFRNVFGEPTPADIEMLRRFVDARKQGIASAPEGAPHALTKLFFEASSTEQALAELPSWLGDGARNDLRDAVQYFKPRYARVWSDGLVVRRFIERSRGYPQRRALQRFLVRLAEFYGVSPRPSPAPTLVLAPVLDGHGTHAQAIGRHLLIEVRPREGLVDEIPPIVHENAHFLFARIPAERLQRLYERAAAAGPAGAEAWQLMLEALPTAVAQGVASSRFRDERFSLEAPWYHLEDVDDYAKTLYPLVRKTLDGDGKLDEAFIEAAVGLHRRD
ncbi:MAG: hypothetical protein GY716_03705 [bacterium]|nr:hypothetical protein [bacterium]